jgi:hypothetical protein
MHIILRHVPVEEARFYVCASKLLLSAHAQFYNGANCGLLKTNKGQPGTPDFVLMQPGKS